MRAADILTLNEIKEELGISQDDHSDDLSLSRAIAQATGLIRGRTRRFLFGQAQITTASGDSVLNSPGHTLLPGQQVRISGSGDSAFDIQHTVKSATRDTFTVDATTQAQSATIHPLVCGYARGTERPHLVVPPSLVPFERIVEVAGLSENGNSLFATTGNAVLLTANQQADFSNSWKAIPDTEWFAIYHETPPKQAVLQADCWSSRFHRTGSLGNTWRRSVLYEYRVISAVGALALPVELDSAIRSVICHLFEHEGTDKGISSETTDGTSKSALTGPEREESLYSHWRVIDSWGDRT